MGSRYLTDLAAVVRAAGLACQEEAGWQSRSRGSGGYSGGLPCAVMIHHTASGPSSDGQPDVDYMCHRADARPIANLYLSRSGKVWVMAAGATNTNGSGGPLGPVPADSMNSSAIGIEAGNDGVGEPWPAAQQEAYVILCRALRDHYAIPTGQVWSHAEWAPGRKVDPAGPSRWTGSGTWNEDAFRGDIATGWPGGAQPQPEPPPPPSALDFLEEGELMFIITSPGKGVAICAINGAGTEWNWIYSGDDQHQFMAAGLPTCTVSAAQFDALLQSSANPVLVSPV